ncbi:MAG: hypothetical protein ABSE73_29365 [Planctomycetota bacterium]
MDPSRDLYSTPPPRDPARSDTSAAPEEPAKTTRRDCTILGMQVFAGGMAGSLLVASAARLVMSLVDIHVAGYAPVDIIKQLLVAWVIAVPPAVLAGAACGFETYRLAAGSLPWRKTGWLVWVLCFCILCYFGLPLFLGYRHRQKLIAESKPVTWGLPLFYGLVLLVLACIFGGMPRNDSLAGLFWGGLLAFFWSDSVLVSLIAGWRNSGRLATPVSHKFQYSLGAMLIFVLGLGAWVTALMKIFGG